jgi:hypothetical protein
LLYDDIFNLLKYHPIHPLPDRIVNTNLSILLRSNEIILHI